MDRKSAIAIAAFASAAAAAPAQAQAPAGPPPATTTTILSRSTTTATGQPLAVPPAPLEVVITRVELPPGGVLPRHKHPWQRYAYVESGRILVRYEAAGIEREFGAGEAAIEAVDQWHEGRVVGSEPVRLIVIDHVPPGRTNVVRP